MFGGATVRLGLLAVSHTFVVPSGAIRSMSRWFAIGKATDRLTVMSRITRLLGTPLMVKVESVCASGAVMVGARVGTGTFTWDAGGAYTVALLPGTASTLATLVRTRSVTKGPTA